MGGPRRADLTSPCEGAPPSPPSWAYLGSVTSSPGPAADADTLGRAEADATRPTSAATSLAESFAAAAPPPREERRSSRSGTIPPKDTRFGAPNGNIPSPGGKPKGFLSLSKAYIMIFSWPREDIEAFLRWQPHPEPKYDEAGNLIDPPPLPEKIAKRIKAAHLVARAMILTASSPGLHGQVRAAVELADRTEGKVTQPVELDGRLATVSGLAAKLSSEGSEGSES